MKYFFIGIIFLILLYFHTRGLFYSDDGYILNSAQRVLLGQIPYKDFHFAYTPLSIFLNAFGFKVLGVSILSSRFVAVLLSFITITVMYKIGKLLSNNKTLQLFPVFVYFAWMPTHSNFLFPTTLSITAGLISCLFILKKNYFWAGIFTIATFLSKQNFGAVLLLNSFFVFIFLKKEKTEFLKKYSLGICVSAVIFTLYLVVSGSLSGFVNDFQTYTLKRIIIEKTLNTPFLFGSNPYEILKSFFYLSPLLLSVFSLLFCFKKKKEYIFLTTFVIFFYILGIRPTTDYIHLTPLLALLGIPILLIAESAKKISYRSFFLFLTVALSLLGFYTGLYKGYYRWDPRLLENNYFLSNERLRVFAFDNELGSIVELVQKETKPNDYIFVNFYSPMFYFAANRQNPTKFDLLESGFFYKPFEKEIMHNIEEKNARLVIEQQNFSGSYLSDYIEKNFTKKTRVWNYLIFEK